MFCVLNYYSYFCILKSGYFINRGLLSPILLHINQMIKQEVLKNIIEEELDNSSLYLVDLNISGSNRLSVYIDSDQGVTIDECVALSRSIEKKLNRDEEDFELQVSSPGLDMPLKIFAQYKKNIGRELEVNFKDGQKIRGKLIAATDNNFELEEQKKIKEKGSKKKKLIILKHNIELNAVKTARVVISFK
jgi:ribosome maturation factor RimP